ncbi:MAG: hypothetical protein AB1736_07285 [Chloroflexota bacterium]
MTRSGAGPTHGRPPTVDVAAAILVFGGLFGLSQLAFGDFVITGSLPAKDPILGVALIQYVASTGLGLLVRRGRLWFPALNLAALFALVYLLSGGRPLHVLLGLLYGLAFGLLARDHRWFATETPGRLRRRD